MRLAVQASAAQRQSQKPKVTDTHDWKEILPKYAFFSYNNFDILKHKLLTCGAVTWGDSCSQGCDLWGQTAGASGHQ